MLQDFGCHLLFCLAFWGRVLLLLAAFVLSPPPAHAFWDTELTFDKAVERLARTLVETGKLQNVYVLINPQDLYDAETQLSLPLASQLRNRLVTEMTKAGAKVLLPGADEETFMLLQGTWHNRGDDLGIDLKVMRLGKDGPEVKAAASVSLPLRHIDPSALTPDRNSWARLLIRRLDSNLVWHNALKVHLPPFTTGGHRCSDEFGPYLAGWLRPALAESGLFQPIDTRRELNQVEVATLRTRGTRGIRPDVPNPDPEPSLTASLLNADAELKGDYYLHGKTIELRATLVDRNGHQLSASSIEMPKELFPADMLVPSLLPKNTPPSVASLTAGCMTVSGLELELTSTRGEDRPYYKKGEQIRFLLRLNRPAWVYLFDLNPAGEAILLYPVDERGHLAKEAGFLREITKPLILPEDGYSFELVADTPFGTDTVWAIAAEIPLDFPPNMGGDWSRAENLVARLRAQGMGLERGYAEAKLELVTGR